MDRIYLTVIALAMVLLLGATGLFVTKVPDIVHNARRVGVVGTR